MPHSIDAVERDENADESEALLECPACHRGTIEEAYLIGDGMPTTETRIECRSRKCKFCDGTGQIPADALSAAPPAAEG